MDIQLFENLTPSNGAIQNLRELLTLTAFKDEDLMRFFTFRGNVQNGKKLGWTGDMSDVGWKGSGCNPTYRKATIAAAEKEWELGEWEVPLEWCYEELENTIAEYTLNKGTDIADLTSNEYMEYIVYPALEKAMIKMMWRMIWFGDKTALNIANGGVITDGVDVTLFTAIDGFWKRFFEIVAANANQRVTIAANSEATYAAQMSALKQPGVAIRIFDDLKTSADPRVGSLTGAGIFATKTLTDALAADVKREYKEIMTWEQVYNGIELSSYDGVNIYRVSIWDRLIQEYQNNGTKWNLPHRAFFGSPEQLFVGSPNNTPISELDIFFDRKQRVNNVYSTGKLGTLVGEDDLFQFAY